MKLNKLFLSTAIAALFASAPMALASETTTLADSVVEDTTTTTAPTVVTDVTVEDADGETGGASTAPASDTGGGDVVVDTVDETDQKQSGPTRILLLSGTLGGEDIGFYRQEKDDGFKFVINYAGKWQSNRAGSVDFTDLLTAAVEGAEEDSVDALTASLTKLLLEDTEKGFTLASDETDEKEETTVDTTTTDGDDVVEGGDTTVDTTTTTDGGDEETTTSTTDGGTTVDTTTDGGGVAEDGEGDTEENGTTGTVESTDDTTVDTTTTETDGDKKE